MKRFVVCWLTATLLVIPTLAHATTWPQVGFDSAATGVNPDETTVGPDNADQWRTRWLRKANAVRTYLSNPVVMEETVYVGGFKVGGDGLHHSQVWAYSLANGAQLWSRRLPCVGAFGLALGEGTLVTTIDCYDEIQDLNYDRAALLAAGSGAKLGYVDLGGPAWGITIYDGLAVIEDGQRELNVIDLATRTLRNMAYYSDNFFGGSPMPVFEGEAWMTGMEGATPAFSDGIAIAYGPGGAAVPLDDGPKVRGSGCGDPPLVICARTMDTYELLWSKPLVMDSFRITNYKAPIIVDGTVYSAGDDVVHAFDLHSGEPVWDTPVPSIAPYARPIAANGVVYVPARNSAGDAITVGLDSNTGEIVTQRGARLGPVGADYAALVNGRLVTTGSAVRVVTFDR